MSKQGQSNYKGINAQSQAAMSLFLQYLRDPNFSYIQLEAPKLADFVLVFNDGHKIICESKAWQEKFTFSHLKGVLNSILRKAELGENDEILIICTDLDDKLEKKVRNIKYFHKFISPEFKRKGFTDRQITILNKVKFWRVNKKFNEKIIYSLFSELIDFWLPQGDINRIIDSILIRKIYKGSEKGARFSREDVVLEIENLRDEVVKKSGYIDTQSRKTEDILKDLGIAVNDPYSPMWSKGQLSALSTQPQLMFYFLDLLKNKKLDNLQEWNELWQLYKIYRFSFSLFEIFEKNLHTEKNKIYILQFFKDNVSGIKTFYQHDFFEVEFVKITKTILDEDSDNKFIRETFKVVKKLISERRDDIFYLKSQRDDFWEREEIAKLVKKIYEKSDSDLKSEVYKFTVKTYNLVEDDGKFSHYTPKEIFETLKDWLIFDFEKRLLALKKELSRQYDELYKKKLRFKKGFSGWELIGGVTSFWGSDYIVSDRHFILYTLQPALKEYYDKSKIKKEGWSFIRRNCISKTDKKTKNKVIKKPVNQNRPDFLNRTIIPIVLERYKSDDKKVSEEAFDILKEFILSRKGIPHKSDLIYQEIRNNCGLSDDKIWKLVKLSIDKFKLPVNPFVEQIALKLAEKGNEEAKRTVKNWLRNPDYYKRGRIFEANIVGIISQFLDFSPDEGIKLFKEIIDKGFIDKIHSFEVFNLAKLLNRIINQNPIMGIRILNDTAEKKKLSKNEQILLFSSLVSRGDLKQENEDISIKIYNNFLDPFLRDLGNNIKQIKEKLFYSQSREGIVEFADTLAGYKKVKEALRIVEIFINDPNPYLPGENPEDPESKYNEHKKILGGEEPLTISSVRGWCAWVLAKCAVLDGRNYIDDIIRLTKKLAKDKNWYVKHMACFALSRLAQVRLSVMPNNKNVLFFNNNIEKALENAKEVEKIAFDLLKEIAKASDNVKKALAKSILQVFNHIRALNQEDTLAFVNIFKKFPDEAIAEAMPLFIGFAEFRREDFKDWKWSKKGLYDDLGNFVDRPFQEILKEIINKQNSKINHSIAIQCISLIKDMKNKSNDSDKFFNIAFKYFGYLHKEYDHEVFNIVYRAVKDAMEKELYFDKWYDLYVKCLKKEKDFYDENFDKEKTMNMYWWPFFYNDDILVLIYQQGDKKKFLRALDIITSFPKELNIHDSDIIISLLKTFSKSNKTAKKIVTQLFERNPSRYYKLRDEWFTKLKKNRKAIR